MGYNNPRFSFEKCLNTMRQFFAHFWVNGWKWVIQKVHIRLAVNRARKINPRPLPATERHAFIAN